MVAKAFQSRGVGTHLASIGEKIQVGWQRAANSAGLAIEIDGFGPISHYGLSLGDPGLIKALIVQEFLRREILGTVVFYGMAAHTDEHIGVYLDAVRDVFADLAVWHRRGELRQRLCGEPAACGFARLN
jgi:hypothetical protein